MSTVKRFEPVTEYRMGSVYAGMAPDPGGEYGLHSDYVACDARCKELEQELAELKARPDGGEVAISCADPYLYYNTEDGTSNRFGSGGSEVRRMVRREIERGISIPLYTRPAPPAVVEGKKDE